MTLLTGQGDEITVGPSNAPGADHAVVLTVTERGEVGAPVVVEVVLRPDDAIALCSVLMAWAADRQEKAGLF